MQAVYSTSSLKQANPTPFKSLTGKLDPGILKALDAMQYEYMTPVQEKVLNSLPSLRTDCLVQAKTGTGKTTAFLLPALQSLVTSDSVPKGQVAILILSPTRELAMQIAKECNQITAHLHKRIECHTAFGGSARATALSSFMNGSPSVLVATPGRLKDYLSEKPTQAKFKNLRTVILDEADTMLEKGFLEDVKHILRLLPPKRSGWQGMCFSATVPDKIKDVLEVVLMPNYATVSTIDKFEPPTHTRVPQYHVVIPTVKDTFTALLSLVEHERQEGEANPKIIVFGTTANLVALYAEFFRRSSSLRVYELQSRLSQPQRTRTTREFKEATSGIMFATDVIGRGMDFPNVTSVIQVGLPMNGEQYVHRVGRTARVDRDGRAVILLTHAESFFLRSNQNLPIRPYVHEIDTKDNAAATEAMATIDEKSKQKAYSAYLGFMKGFMNKLQLKPEALVAMANELAIKALHCPGVPPMEKKTIGKMGLRGVQGINYGTLSDDESPSKRMKPNVEQRQTFNSAPRGGRAARGRGAGGGGRGGMKNIA
ncbi:ATP-dependent RNA helicase mss116 [Endocarpon pusillum Z07020]|uniref:ATP-dependent RNA helicase n=1 Tax=Endocarpon pusillum (strain Z07020 / HMAS-L-300199) TaxID=1263415 RepID=U1GKW9_ENDPU|nr:ATP-dependent RNA helicase mss116 [Endocarpon pusillum Z07020]ERF72858.1 ATP-dependent RNA helicase mss116 [Endocarpon pusillum Z07020]